MYQKLKTQFLEIMVPFLAEHEFLFDKKLSNHRFRHYFKNGEFVTNRLKFDLREPVDLYIDISAIIVHKEVESIRKSCKDEVDLGKDSATVEVRSRSLTPSTHPLYRQTAYCIRDPRSTFMNPLSQTVAEIKDLLVEIVFPFFYRYQTVADLDQWFNQPLMDGTYDYDRSPTWNDSVQGLIVAKLNHNPNYERLYQLWLKNLHPDNKVEINRVKAVKISLDGLNV